VFKETEYLHFKNRLLLDKMRIDDELIEHPPTLQSVVELCAEAISNRDHADITLKIILSETADKLRQELDGKISEARIAAELDKDFDVQEARLALERAKHDYNLWNGLVDSFKEKGGSLKRISELIIAGYIAPNSAYDLCKEEMNAKRRERVRVRE